MSDTLDKAAKNFDDLWGVQEAVPALAALRAEANRVDDPRIAALTAAAANATGAAVVLRRQVALLIPEVARLRPVVPAAQDLLYKSSKMRLRINELAPRLTACSEWNKLTEAMQVMETALREITPPDVTP